MEVMQQISAAVESASQLEVAELLDDRASDGSLPIPPVPNGNAEGKGPAAAAVARLLKRKTVGNGEGVEEGAEGSQLPNAKRQRADEQHLERQDGAAAGTAPEGISESEPDQMQEASESTAQENRPSSLSQPAGHDLAASVSRSLDPSGSEVTVSAAHQADADAAIPSGHSATDASTNAMSHDHSRPHDADEAGPSMALPEQDAAHGLDQPGASIVLSDPAAANGLHPLGPNTMSPDQVAANGPEPPGPNTTLPDQDAANAPEQPGPSTQLPYQGQEEEVSHELKEKKEQARSRSRAWRKVLLDSLDLLAELTAAAAAAAAIDDSDHLDLAQDCQVRLGFDNSGYTALWLHGAMLVHLHTMTGCTTGSTAMQTMHSLNCGISLIITDKCGLPRCVLPHHTNIKSCSPHPDHIMPKTATFHILQC